MSNSPSAVWRIIEALSSIRAVLGNSFINDRVLTLLPEPLSPTRPQDLPFGHVERHVVDRSDVAVVGAERHAEVAHLK